jgi:hypothetical protein
MRPAGQGSGTTFFGKDQARAEQAEKTKLKEIGSQKKWPSGATLAAGAQLSLFRSVE